MPAATTIITPTATTTTSTTTTTTTTTTTATKINLWTFLHLFTSPSGILIYCIVKNWNSPYTV